MSGQAGIIDILTIVSPIFIIISIGFAAVRLNIVAREGGRAMAAFVICFALPSLIFKALTEHSLAEILHPTYMLAYGLGSLLSLIIALVIAHKLRRKSLTDSAIVALGSSFSNSAFIGYPVVLQLLGPVALVPIALTLIIENTLTLPLVLALAERGSNRNERFLRALLTTLKRVLKNPIIIAIILGVVCAAFNVRVPALADRVINMLALSSGAVALFVIGGSLVGLELNAKIGDISQIAIGKLIIHPLAVLCLLLVLPTMDPQLSTAAVMLAAMPMLSIYPLLGQKYGLEETCAAALLATTALSFITLSGFIWWLEGFHFFA